MTSQIKSGIRFFLDKYVKLFKNFSFRQVRNVLKIPILH